MTRRRTATLTLLGLVASSAAILATAGTARAAEPVVVGDAVSGYAGAIVEVTPLANDSDPDGDDLAVCRVADSPYKKVTFFEVDDQVVLFLDPRIKSGTYTFTYYACDFETLVAGTITLTVKKAPKIKAKALPGRPGMIKVTNPAGFRIVFLYGSFKNENPDGVVKIARNSAVTFRVRRTTIDWVAYAPRNGFSAMGHVRGIKLPPGTTPPDVDRRLTPRAADLWRS